MRLFAPTVPIAWALLLSAGALFAQPLVPGGRELAARLPARIGRVASGEVTSNARSATASYPLPDGRSASLEVQRVIGEGSDERQHSLCPRITTIAGYPGCLRARDGLAGVLWVLDDAILVILLAPDEPTLMGLARSLDLSPYARIAAQMRAAQRAAPPAPAPDDPPPLVIGDVASGSSEPPAPPDPEESRRRADLDAVAEVIDRQFERVDACYQNERRRQPALAGRLITRFTVGPRGRITALTTEGPIAERSPGMVRCMGALLRGMTFPARVRHGTELRFPFVFRND